MDCTLIMLKKKKKLQCLKDQNKLKIKQAKPNWEVKLTHWYLPPGNAISQTFMATRFRREGWWCRGQVERGNQTIDDFSQLCTLQENSKPFTATNKRYG